MLTDALHDFGLPGITNSTTKTVSPRVLDAQSAKYVFGGRQKLICRFKTVITADATPIISIEMWGGDAADGDVNDNESVMNDILGATGIIRCTPAGVALVTTDVVEGEFWVGVQKRACRYYGLNTTLGTTNPDIVEATSWAYVMRDGQSNMLGARAAVPT